jgi:Raf kinase inhibitor-like YbhB/YbcL family protein
MRQVLSAFCLIAWLPISAGAATLPEIHVSSASFANGTAQPRSVAFAACGGGDISPQLSWRGAPAGTKSFALTEFDTDARAGAGFWHWLVVNIPPSVTSLNAGATLPAGAVAGMTDHGLPGYQGPCPPVGDPPHHYIFTISALNVASLPSITAESTGTEVKMALQGHVIAQGIYTGTYAR